MAVCVYTGVQLLRKITKYFMASGMVVYTIYIYRWIMIVVVWQQAGYMMIVYIAQLQSIPDNLIEAAEIDGAGRLQRLKNLILPLCMPAFTIGFFLTLSGTFRLYDQNLALTNGGPYGSTQMVCMNIYRTAFGENDLGRAQAKALIFVIVIAIVSLTQLYCSKKMEVEM